MLGLNVRTARVSSDGGWFVDEFRIANNDSTKVTGARRVRSLASPAVSLPPLLPLHWDLHPRLPPADLAKLESVSRMLNVRALGETEDQPTVSVFEISGLDRPRLFGDLVNLLHSSGCSVRSVAAWTFQSRCAFTIAVADQGAAIADPARQEDLVRHMLHIMTLDCPSAAPADQPTVTCEEARVPVNHERRLHRLMLAASQRAFDPTAPPEEVREEVSDGDGAAEGEGAEEEDEDCVPQDIEPEVRIERALCGRRRHPSGGSAMRLPRGRSDAGWPHRPQVTIMEGSSGYWEVLIQCADRPKLMFDAVCTLADMDYEIYHATVDIVESVALLEFYIRPRNTEGAFDDVAARRLEHALKGSIARRFPKGLKIHLHLADVSLMLGDLLTSLGRAGLNITRARVVDDAAGVHALYVMRADGGFPSRRVVEGVCRSVGGTMLPAGVVPPHGWRSKSGSFVGDGPLAAPCSSAGSVGVALSDANAAEAGESTLHGAAFMFQFCGRGKPGHRRDLSGQGSLLQRRRQELDEDLTRAQSSTDLQIYDWSRYVHGSRSNL